MADVTVSREIAAPPDALWEMVSDLTRMGEWSPEAQGGSWTKGATGPEVGARFRGRNRNGWHAWSTAVTVVGAERGRHFAFRSGFMGIPVADWAYDLEPIEGGTRVTESWTDCRPGYFKPVARLATGVADRVEHNRATMEATLEHLAEAAEAG